MAKEIRTFGLKALRFGAVKEDGTAPKTSEMEELVRTKRDTCKISEDETQTSPLYCDQEDDPIEIFKGEKGEKTIEVDTFDYNPETLKKLKGGTVAQIEEDGTQLKVWSESTTGEDIYQAVEIETRTELKFRFPKCLILAKLDTEFKRGDVVLLRLKIKPVSPANGKPSVQILSKAE